MKRIVAVLISLFIFVPFLVNAQPEMRPDSTMPHYSQAQALKTLGLFSGTEQGFELDRTATRLEAGIMLIRLLGKEKEATEAKYAHPFTDVPDWADAYVGYMYKAGLAGGISETEYGSHLPINALQYITFVLRALGYDDKTGEFAWNDSVNAAYDWGVIGETNHKKYNSGSEFLRDDMVNISAKALDRSLKGQQKKRLINRLIEQGTVTGEVAEKAGFYTGQGLFTPLDFGELNGISQIDPEAFNMDIEKTPWRNQYNYSIRNIRILIDKTKLAGDMKRYTNLSLHRSWIGKMDKDSLAAFLKSGEKSFWPANGYEIDDEGWIMMMLESKAYDVLMLANSNNKILGYLAIKYHFDEDIAEYPDLSDRLRLIDKGVINGMKPLKKVSLTRSGGQIKAIFDKSEMPEAVYETVKAFKDDPEDMHGPNTNRIEESITEYSNETAERLKNERHGPGPEINAWMPTQENSTTYSINPYGWGENLCLYVVYDKSYKPVGYSIIEMTKTLIH